MTIDRKILLHYLPTDSVCAEVGVAKGKFSREILTRNKPKKLFLIDSWEYFDIGYVDYNMVTQEEHDRRYYDILNEFGKMSNVEIIKNFSTKGIGTLPDNSLDWIYIDADHSFEGCYKDLVASHPKIKDIGYICGHDYLAEHKIQEGFGVNEAVHQFAKEYNYELIFLTSENDYRSYVLSKSEIAKNNFLNSLPK